MFLFLYTYFLKSAYYAYLITTTIGYYCCHCPVKEKNLDNILFSLDSDQTNQASGQMLIIPIPSKKEFTQELTARSAQYYHDQLEDIEGSMQHQIRKWKTANPGSQMPFEQQYRLWIFNKILEKELFNVGQNISLLLATKKQAIKKGVQNFIPKNDDPYWIVQQLMSFACSSGHQYDLVGEHYVHLSQAIRRSYDYTPCYCLLPYVFMVFSFYHLIMAYSTMQHTMQFKETPLKINGATRQMIHDQSLKFLRDLARQVNHQLSLCCPLDNHMITTQSGTPLEKALITHNSTAIQLAIEDLSFHGVQQNKEKNYLLIPFINSWVDNEKENSLTNFSFCEEFFFMPHQLAKRINDHTRINLVARITDFKAAMIDTKGNHLVNSVAFIPFSIFFMFYRAIRLKSSSAIMGDFMTGYMFSSVTLLMLAFVSKALDSA